VEWTEWVAGSGRCGQVVLGGALFQSRGRITMTQSESPLHSVPMV